MEEMVEVYEETDEKLKAYLEKDASVEDLLGKKISELNEEKQKLSNKYTELKKLESSYRDKLTRDASTDEIRKIADDIDRVKEEVTDIQKNIEFLETDINKITETKKQTEESKESYIANVSKTIIEYEKKLEAINKAIEVCNNDSLKEAFKEEQTKMQNELNTLKSKREEELDKAVELTINNSDKSKQSNEENKVELPKIDFEEVVVSNLISPNNEEETKNDINTTIEEVKVVSNQVDSAEESKVELNKLEEKLSELANEQENEEEPSIKIDQDLVNRLVEEELMRQGLINQSEKREDTSNLDSLLNNSMNIEEDDDTQLEVETTPLIVPDIDLSNLDLQNTKNIEDKKEETSGKVIIDNLFVDASKISQILGSSGVMPSVYKWLDNNISEDKKEAV